MTRLAQDVDDDGHVNTCDNCPTDSNVDQADIDCDGIGTICEDEPEPSPRATMHQRIDVLDDTRRRIWHFLSVLPVTPRARRSSSPTLTMPSPT